MRCDNGSADPFGQTAWRSVAKLMRDSENGSAEPLQLRVTGSGDPLIHTAGRSSNWNARWSKWFCRTVVPLGLYQHQM